MRYDRQAQIDAALGATLPAVEFNVPKRERRKAGYADPATLPFKAPDSTATMKAIAKTKRAALSVPKHPLAWRGGNSESD